MLRKSRSIGTTDNGSLSRLIKTWAYAPEILIIAAYRMFHRRGNNGPRGIIDMAFLTARRTLPIPTAMTNKYIMALVDSLRS